MAIPEAGQGPGAAGSSPWAAARPATHHRRRAVARAALALALVLGLLVGCDDGGTDAEPPPVSTTTAPSPSAAPPASPVAVTVTWDVDAAPQVIGQVQSDAQRARLVGATAEAFGDSELEVVDDELAVDDRAPATDDRLVEVVAAVVEGSPEILREGQVLLRDGRLFVEGTLRVGVERGAVDTLLTGIDTAELEVLADVAAAPRADPFEITYSTTDDGVRISGRLTDDDDVAAVLADAEAALGANEVNAAIEVGEVDPDRGTVRLLGVVGEGTAATLRSLWDDAPATVDVIDDLVVTAEATIVEQANEIAELAPIRFASGDATLTESALATVDQAAELFRPLTDVRIRVEGHTDGFGDPEENLELSQQRAEAVRDALVQRGVDPDVLVAVGFGAAHPLLPDDLPGGAAANRRIDFRLLSEPGAGGSTG